MSTVPNLPRAQWRSHPRFRTQALLLGSHRNFRLLARDVRRLAQSRPEPAGRRFRAWMYAMGSHEHYEESKLYPYLERRWGVSMARLVEGHEALDRCKAEVFDGFARVQGEGSGAAGQLDRALLRLTEVLDAHLDLEEETVIPLLLELEPDEFADYYALPIGTLLARMA
ncbi:MAG: hemerythrin domain-containing protein [Sandaracinaceae bacterium]